MNRRISALLIIAVLAGFVAAQQPNTFQASMRINGAAGPPYPILGVGLPRGLPQNVLITSVVPNAPFVLFGGPALNPAGWPVLGGQLLDVNISVGGFILLDGVVRPTVYNTGPTGAFNNSIVLPATATLGTRAAFQCLVADPSVAIYASRLTAATEVIVSQGLTVIPLTLPDDGGVPVDFVPFGMTFPYYSNTWTRTFVNCDGNITFGSASSDFTPTPTEFRMQQPRIAPMWTDLNMGFAGAQVNVTVNQSGLTPFPTITVDWIQMAEWGNVGARHTFQLVLNMVTGDIQVNHDPFNIAMTYDQLMGIAAGGGIDPVGGWQPQHDLSTLPGNPYLMAIDESMWEWFGLANGTMPYYTPTFNNPWDMVGTTTNWTAISAGLPNMAQYYAN